MTGVHLLQPDAEVAARVSGVEALSQYIQAIAHAVRAKAAGLSAPPTAGHVVVAVRSGLRSKAWLDVEPPLPAEQEATLVRAAESVPPTPVRGGLVVFGIRLACWGSHATPDRPPVPAAWRALYTRPGQLLDATALAAAAWDASTPSSTPIAAQP
jgi:hypothetical protein